MIKNILSKTDQQEIINAINQAEGKTSGEIRIHIENQNNKPPLERAKKVFYLLGIDKTQKQNGILFFVCLKSKSLAIIGDKGINEKVPAEFWEQTKNTVLEKFKQGEFKKGLILGIEQTANQLEQFFPLEKENINELTNSISIK